MGFIFFVYLVYSNLNSILKILNEIMTKYLFLANKNNLTLEIGPSDFIKISLRFSS